MIVRMLGNQQDAEDALQEIMLKLWNRRKKIAAHPNLTGLVFLTARNHCLDLLKKKRPDMEASDFRLKMLPAPGGQQQVEWEELNRIIKELLLELPEQQREVMMLRDMDGLEYSEMAAVMGLKVEHIRVILSRARKRVVKQLKEIYNYEQGKIG